jgi:hypothetical protein
LGAYHQGPKAFDRLPFDATHLVVIVKLVRNNFVEIGRHFVLRLDPKTERVIGLTIVDFSKHFAAIGKKVPPKGNFNAERLLKQLWAGAKAT